MNRRELLSAAVVAPLPFEPTKIKGLSEKLLTSPHANNYGRHGEEPGQGRGGTRAAFRAMK